MATRENAWEKNTVQKLWVEEHRAQHQANLNEFTGAGQKLPSTKVHPAVNKLHCLKKFCCCCCSDFPRQHSLTRQPSTQQARADVRWMHFVGCNEHTTP